MPELAKLSENPVVSPVHVMWSLVADQIKMNKM